MESESKVSDVMERVMSGSSLDAEDVALILERGVDLDPYPTPGVSLRVNSRRIRPERRRRGAFPP